MRYLTGFVQNLRTMPWMLPGITMTDLPENMNSPNGGAAISSEERQATHLCKNKLSEMETDAHPVFFTNTITREQAFKAVQAWWSDRLIAGNLSNEVQNVDCQLNYFPFRKLTVHVSGYVKGYRIESDDVSDTKVPMDVQLDNDLVWTGIACDPGELGIYYVQNLIGKTASCDPCTGQVAEVTVRQADAISEGIKALEYGVVRYADVPNVTAHDVHLQHPRLDLIFYPFWTIRYLYHSHNYFVTIDGVTGDLISGRAPGNIVRRMFAFVTAIAVILLEVLVVVYIEKVILLDSGTILLVIFILGHMLFFCGIFIHVNFVFLYYGSEITLGDLDGGYRSSSERVPQKNNYPITGMLMGIAFMLFGGFVYLNKGKWLALIPAISGLVIYIISCMFLYRTEWGTTNRSWISDAHPVKIQEEARSAW